MLSPPIAFMGETVNLFISSIIFCYDRLGMRKGRGMTFELTYYNYTSSHPNQLGNDLQSLKADLSTHILDFATLGITDGERCHKDTHRFIGDLVRRMGSEINFDNMVRDLWDERERMPGLTTRTIICVEQSGLRFKENADWHGLTGDGFCAVVLQPYKNPYKNIVWHEVAHLFGAEDHYNCTNKTERAPQCTAGEEEECIMQYDPGTKQCLFCSGALQEIRSGMSKMPRSPHDLLSFQL